MLTVITLISVLKALVIVAVDVFTGQKFAMIMMPAPRNKCVFTQRQCDACTTEECDSNTGYYVYTIVNCHHYDACTSDGCDATSGCTHEPVPCWFTVSPVMTLMLVPKDSCNPSSGCEYKQIECNDNNDCTKDSCERDSGCKHEGVDCDDYNACTKDSCECSGGCKHEEIDCDDYSECTKDTCNPDSGCDYEPLFVTITMNVPLTDECLYQ